MKRSSPGPSLDNEMELDVEKSRVDLIKVAARLISENPDVGAVVLECTNMMPYAAAIQEEIEFSGYSIYTPLSNMVHQAAGAEQSSRGYM